MLKNIYIFYHILAILVTIFFVWAYCKTHNTKNQDIKNYIHHIWSLKLSETNNYTVFIPFIAFLLLFWSFVTVCFVLYTPKAFLHLIKVQNRG